MKYTDFEKDVADFENGRYEARLDRAKQNVEDYLHKNHVHIFDRRTRKLLQSMVWLEMLLIKI